MVSEFSTAIKLFEMSPKDGQADKTYAAHSPGYWGGGGGEVIASRPCVVPVCLLAYHNCSWAQQIMGVCAQGMEPNRLRARRARAAGKG